MVHDHGRAEDITQEVFMSALRRMRETERLIVFKPWVYEIAKNACIDAFRRSKRAEEISYDAEEGLGHSDYGRLVSSSPTPDAAVDTRMSLDNLRGAFGGLSETHHDIIVMRELEGLSYREIGRRLGMSRASVESTLFRARRRLTEEYEELTSGERCISVQGMMAGGGDRRLGVREERKLARHVSYCQPCRRAAYAAGFDVAALQAKKSLGAKVAGLFPFPALVRRWFGGGGGDGGGSAASGSGAGTSSSLAQWSATVGQHAEQVSGWAKAAAVAATVAVAGVGAGVATTHGDADVKAPRRPAAGAPVSSGAIAAKAKAGRGPGATTGAAASRPAGSARRSSSKTSKTSTTASKRRAARGGAGGSSGAGSSAGASSAAGAGGSSAAATAPTGGGSASASGAAGKPGSQSGVSAPKVPAPKLQAPNSGTPAVDTAAGTVAGTVNQATGAATGVVNTARDAATGVVNGAGGAVAGAGNGTTGSAASGAVNSPTAAAAGAVTGAVSTASGATSGAVGTASGAVSNPTGTASGAASNPTGAVGGAVGGLLPHG